MYLKSILLIFLFSAGVVAARLRAAINNDEAESEIRIGRELQMTPEIQMGDTCAGKWCSWRYKRYWRSCSRPCWYCKKDCSTVLQSEDYCKQVWGSKPSDHYGPTPTVRYRRVDGTGESKKCQDRKDIGYSGCEWKKNIYGDRLAFMGGFLTMWYCGVP